MYPTNANYWFILLSIFIIVCIAQFTHNIMSADEEVRSKKKMTNIISRCSVCGQFFQSKKDVKGHKDKKHRI
jgi:hypothetical protein